MTIYEAIDILRIHKKNILGAEITNIKSENLINAIELILNELNKPEPRFQWQKRKIYEGNETTYTLKINKN